MGPSLSHRSQAPALPPLPAHLRPASLLLCPAGYSSPCRLPPAPSEFPRGYKVCVGVVVGASRTVVSFVKGEEENSLVGSCEPCRGHEEECLGQDEACPERGRFCPLGTNWAPHPITSSALGLIRISGQGCPNSHRSILTLSVHGLCAQLKSSHLSPLKGPLVHLPSSVPRNGI